MVDNIGRWHWESDLPRQEWCDLDYLMECIVNHGGYNPDYVCMETFLLNIIDAYYSEIDDMRNENSTRNYFAIEEKNPDSPLMINADDVWEFIQASGGLQEFDYNT